MPNSPIYRRSVLQAGILPGSAAMADRAIASPDESRKVRVGFVGVGVKGWQHVRNLLHIDHAELVAVCDVRRQPCELTKQTCRQLGRPEPKTYTRGDHDFQRMCDTEDLDLVYTATPWRWHVPICVAAMQSGSHAATEIPAALTLDDCWKIVETSEQTRRHFSMMENVNYRRDELMVLRMCREGVLGTLNNAEAGYMHDTRYLKARSYGDGLWLGDEHATRNGNLYPTHGLGPLAWNFDLGRGNRMEYLVSMSSNAEGMNLYADEHLPPDHPYRKRRYINGDVNTSLIKLAGGQTIVIKHDTDLPRPYSRTNLVQGTRGIVRGFPDFQISLEATDLTEGLDDPDAVNAYKGPHHKYDWKPGRDYYEQYDHPLWKMMSSMADKTPTATDGFDLADAARSGDYLEDYRLIDALANGRKPDFDVYDAASWSVVSALSERSVANRSQAVDFPDFTKGQWQTRPPIDLSV